MSERERDRERERERERKKEFFEFDLQLQVLQNWKTMIDLNVEFEKQGSVSVSSSKKIGCSVTRFDKISPAGKI